MFKAIICKYLNKPNEKIPCLIGLKSLPSQFKGNSLRFNVRTLKKELRWAFQRMWRGYDNMEVCDISQSFITRMLPIMQSYRKNNIAMFNDMDEKQTNETIDKMIDLLKKSNPDTWLYDETIDVNSKEDLERANNMEKEAYDNQKLFLEMFVKYFDDLWY